MILKKDNGAFNLNLVYELAPLLYGHGLCRQGSRSDDTQYARVGRYMVFTVNDKYFQALIR